MTSYTKGCLNFDLIDGKTIQILLIASVRTLKRENEKYDREKISKLVNDAVCNKTCSHKNSG